MYNGIQRKQKEAILPKAITKHQIIATEQVITNGIIREQFKVKTHDFTADKKIKYDDFEVNNLKAAGIDVEGMPTATLNLSKERQAGNAERANEMMNYYELINNLENEQEQQQQEN